MEKKSSRLLQPACKGASTDSKKAQDGAGGKALPRGGRRREPTGGGPPTKGDTIRKQIQPRATKTFDKRPRQRGAYNPPAVGRAEAARLETEYEAELGSVFVPGSKKQSLNHLLNFVYASPPNEGRYQSERGPKTAANRLMLTKKHKYNKEHFLQANCQFIVNSLGDYTQYLNNPDVLVDWNLIEQVNVQVSEFPSCPICLYPPVAAKMTRCGHIYCWSCVLHYLSLSDKTWRKCPICYESIHKNDLKSVVSIPHNTFNVNDTITFKLMKRAKGSLIAYPAEAEICSDVNIFQLSQYESSDIYSKLLIAGFDDILNIIEREHNDLKQQLVENKDCPENCFTEQGLLLLDERKCRVLESLVNVPQIALKESPVLLADTLSENAVEEDLNANISSEMLEMPTTSNQIKFHYFYQASDGQHIYLHAINARMLEHSYGSLENGPKTITGRILEKEGGSMTEELRKRLRYLQHLPVTCQFEVAEIHLNASIVQKETLNQFNEQLEIRKKRRQHRARDEKKREKRIAEEENRLLGKFPTPVLHIESNTQFPCFESRTRTESDCTLPSDSSEPSGSLGDCGGPSFAKMLSNSAQRSPKWPDLRQARAEPVKLINVTGQKMAAAFRTVNRSDSEPEAEDYFPAQPSRSLGDAIVQALEKVDLGEVDSPAGGKRKKRKNRQKVLFSTTMAYSEK